MTERVLSAGLIVLSVVQGGTFVLALGRPWRYVHELRGMAWLQSVMAATTLVLDVLLLLVVLRVPILPIIAIITLAAVNAGQTWRLVALRRARHDERI